MYVTETEFNPPQLSKKPAPTATLLRFLMFLVIMGLVFSAGFASNYFAVFDTLKQQSQLLTPILSLPEKTVEKPLQKYALSQLTEQVTTAATALELTEEYSQQAASTSYIFTFTSQGKNISGLVTIPNTPPPENGFPVIVMSRGYAPPEDYYPGFGTKNAAAAYAAQGYVTVAPDFLGFGSSDDEYENTWEGRFAKPLQILDLIETLENYPQLDFNRAALSDEEDRSISLNSNAIGLWGHSNGGQITLAVLEASQRPLPATVWAPVTAPFPYSILFFGNDLPDEGKAQRAWIALLEDDYDVFDFSITQHVDRLQGPLQIHHGAADDAALQSWSDLFVERIEEENDRRESAAESSEVNSGNTAEAVTAAPIEYAYFQYPQADHNLRPDWNTVVARDIAFFDEYLK